MSRRHAGIRVRLALAGFSVGLLAPSLAAQATPSAPTLQWAVAPFPYGY